MPELDARQLHRTCDPATLGFRDTSELEPLPFPPGQAMARDAVRRGARMRADGYNIYALGAPEVFKRDAVERLLRAEPRSVDHLRDRAYLDDLSGGRSPRALELPAGTGTRLRADVDAFVDDLIAALPTLFDDEAFRSRSGELLRAFQTEQKERMLALSGEAEQEGLRLLQTPGGFAFAPLGPDGQVIEPEAFRDLPQEEQQRLEEKIEAFQHKLLEIMQTLPQRQRNLAREQRALARERAAVALDQLLEPLRERYGSFPVFREHLQALREHVLDQLPRLIAAEGQNEPGLEDLTRPYRVNVVLDRDGVETVPVVYESNPTVEALFGRIDHRITPVGWQTDASLIRVGSFQRADGGYLLLDAERLLARPLAWDALKRALQDGRAYLEAPMQLLSLGGGYGLEPEPMPVRVRVVLLGSRLLYYLLARHDPDFEALFRIAAEFEDELPITEAAIQEYARWIATMARDADLRPLDAPAVARVIEHAGRHAADAERLTTHTRTLCDLITEADFEAATRAAPVIGVGDVEAALRAREQRLDRIRRDMLDAVVRETVLIDTQGTATGQINGLSVLRVGGRAFGRPARITATARLGGGRVIDIEREAELGGSIHSKGLMIVSSFVGARFGRTTPLSLHASIVFEQSYGGVDGDSASAAEVCALLSAVGAVPVRQDLAVTGSMNQHGAVQAIGGVNEKIEGFFRVCEARGLTGTQGVVIPQANARHLMLSPEVRDACAAGRFHVWSVTHIDEVLELFTGLPAGQEAADGTWTPESINGRVAARIAELARASRAQRAGNDDRGEDEP